MYLRWLPIEYAIAHYAPNSHEKSTRYNLFLYPSYQSETEYATALEYATAVEYAKVARVSSCTAAVTPQICRNNPDIDMQYWEQGVCVCVFIYKCIATRKRECLVNTPGQ